MTAARTGRIGAVKALLSRGADVNWKEQNGQTALMWAAAEGHAEVVELLIEAGADFRTPLAIPDSRLCSLPCAKVDRRRQRLLESRSRRERSHPTRKSRAKAPGRG